MSNPRKHSFSRLSTFAEICERRHAFDALIPGDWNTPAIKRGNHVHDALEQMAKLMLAGETAVEAAEYLAENPPEGYLKEADLAQYLEKAIPVLEHLKPRPGGVESWFDSVADLPIVGKIDIISLWTPIVDGSGIVRGHTEGLFVGDYKTTNSPARIKSEHQARKSLQLQIYCLATGARNAGFIYLLPGKAPVRVTSVKFSEEDLEFARKWLTNTLDVVDYRWKQAKELSGCDNGAPEVDGYNLLPFSLAEPGHGLCSAKYCPHWSQCVGKDAT